MATKSNDAAFFFCLAREKNEKSGNNMDWDTKTKYIHNKKNQRNNSDKRLQYTYADPPSRIAQRS